ncbi:MAG: PAS domain S-box protein [Desulfobacteraceae bacterium]|nr:MAG: PAS domain S-box protein [Desulfobacteraceae bacterium]
MGKPLRLLIVEDSEDDALLTILALKKGGYDPVYERVEDAVTMRKALLEKPWDFLLCDYQMPQFNGLVAIALLNEIGIDIPLIIVSGAIGEEMAVECMRLGARDFFIKGKLTRLVSAIERELKNKDSRLQRKRIEEALWESEEKYRWMLDNMADVITLMDMNLRFTYVSPSIIRMRGYTAEEATAQTLEQVMTPESLQISAEVFEEEMRLEASGTADPDRVRIVVVEQYRKDGSIVLMENHLSFMRDEAKKPVGIISVSHDITERKRAEEEIKQREVFLNTLLRSIPIPIFYKDRDGRYAGFNRAYENFFGTTKEKLIGKTVFDISPPELAKIYHAKDNDLLESGVEQEYESQVKNTLGVIRDVIFNKAVFTDSKGTVNGLIGTILDITERKQAEEKLKDTLESLRKSFGTIIQVMVSAVEVRDPYTAGHQIRSADLARAIATEMGLPQEKIDGIRMAGSIHDIGKLSIPAEILSKPGKLSAIEFSLIKEHPLKGYEMLEDVESPWPLAEIVYQHHERIDGSGYPRNLKGDEILLEARIMAVADVVESMASHRPYRPAHAINAALEEIEKNKETLYDANAVDACLRLFREKGFQLGK